MRTHDQRLTACRQHVLVLTTLPSNGAMATYLNLRCHLRINRDIRVSHEGPPRWKPAVHGAHSPEALRAEHQSRTQHDAVQPTYQSHRNNVHRCCCAV